MGPLYTWPLSGQFLDRSPELARLEEWWDSDDSRPVNVYGRRRTGKSWLLRRFAHGKPALIVPAERLVPGAQLERFATMLEPLLGVRPALPDVQTFFRVLFQAAKERKLLVVVDEFPWLLGSSEGEADRQLTAIQAVLEEERDTSPLKLVLCGSAVSQMEALQSERNPLHGRLSPLEVRPLDLAGARLFLDGLDPISQMERYAVAGGMPLYLSDLAGPDIASVVCKRVLNPHGTLWNEPRTVLEGELRQPGVYFSMLELLASGDKYIGEIATPLRIDTATANKYLVHLADLRLVSRRLPVGASPSSRGGHWHIEDPFFRFWFRFVFPYQSELETGLAPADLYRTEVRPALPEHVAGVFEDWARSWVRATYGSVVSQVGPWWGHALNPLRQSGERTSEEIDIVGLARRQVVLVGEAKWTERKLGARTLSDLETYKLPALAQAGLKVVKSPTIVLMSKSGYTNELVQLADRRGDLQLVDVGRALAGR
ncbi:MAG TPA: DUF234 domain-containing protein [Acidimicrobiales bacterium]|nr:DUF234 domain-containing protein [Acidimicrobiales bacterium]